MNCDRTDKGELYAIQSFKTYALFDKSPCQFFPEWHQMEIQVFRPIIRGSMVVWIQSLI